MKKIFAVLFCVCFCATLFAASFKVGQKLYVSKDSVLKNEKSEKIATLEKGDVVIVIESEKKTSKIKIEGNDSVSGWVDNNCLTKKKVVKSYSGKKVSGTVDEIALSGKASVSAKVVEEKKEEAKTEEVPAEVKTEETVAEPTVESPKTETAVPEAESKN